MMEGMPCNEEVDNSVLNLPHLLDKPLDMEEEQRAPLEYSIISRPAVGTAGRQIKLLSNHFDVSLNVPDVSFFQYTVSISLEDERTVKSMAIRRKLIERIYEIYPFDFGGKGYAFDGAKNLYTLGPLPQSKFEYKLVLEDSAAESTMGNSSSGGSPSQAAKRFKHLFQERSFKIKLCYAAQISLKSIAFASKGAVEDVKVQDALRVLNTILRQQAANRGCLLVRQSILHDDALKNSTDVGGGVIGLRGYHSSFRFIQSGLCLNLDVTTTMILKPGPVIQFLLSNQDVREPRYIDWAKAKRMLKNLRVNAIHRNTEFKITGLSEKPCNQQYFSLKVKNGSGPTEGQEVDITVYDYFTNHCGIELSSSVYLPCLDVGKPKRPIYLPLELCSLVSLQRYTKPLSPLQKASLIEKSRQKPEEKKRTLTDAMTNNCYNDDPLLAACGISMGKQFSQVDGRVLETPKLKVGNGNVLIPQNGRWNFNNMTLVQPVTVEHWAVVNFSSCCDTSYISRELISCGRNLGMNIERPYTLIEEDQQWRKDNAATRVEKMFDQIVAKLPGPPTFILCVLAERKNSNIYGPWKKKCLFEFGIVSQCISPSKISNRYLTNVLLKMNAKLGGLNSMLVMEKPCQVPLIKDTPTIILGMDVSHCSPGRSDIPSVAAVVGSICWPLISRYRASVRTQSPRLEIIDALYKPLEDGTDDGIVRELLVDFYTSSNGRKPTQFVVFRDGVSESQFNQVLSIELGQIIKAYQHLGEVDVPKFTVVVAQKNHRTKLFQENLPDNVPPGTVVDTKIVHPRNYDFYMCSHAGLFGTSRPTHYHLLVDEIGFSVDEMQNLIHSLCYVYQKSTAAISVVAPITYAHLAAAQMAKTMEFEDLQEPSSCVEDFPLPELPRLHEDVESTMFFC